MKRENAWDGTKYWVVTAADGSVVCMEPTEFYAYPEGPFIEPYGRKANADLIAAAPDLLEACEELLDLAESLLAKEEDKYDIRIEKARAAIAKATGEH